MLFVRLATVLLSALVVVTCARVDPRVGSQWVGVYEQHWIEESSDPSSEESNELGGSAQLIILRSDGSATRGRWRPELGRWADAEDTRSTGTWRVASGGGVEVDLAPPPALLGRRPGLPHDRLNLDGVAPDRLRASRAREWCRVPRAALGPSGEPREYRNPLK